MYVYVHEVGGAVEVWQVGFYRPSGAFVKETNYENPDDAACRVNYLNGGSGASMDDAKR